MNSQLTLFFFILLYFFLFYFVLRKIGKQNIVFVQKLKVMRM